jgi:histidinol-phosphate phosphatase family protein
MSYAELSRLDDRGLDVSESLPRRGALFLDRDGVLNEDVGFVGDIARFRWIEGTRAAIKTANDSGLLVFVVTNQSGVARGFFDEEAVRRVHVHMQAELREIGARIDDFRYCPYHPQGSVPAYTRPSPWRKPEPGMILDLMAHWPVDPTRSILIGDRGSDVEAGHAAGIAAYRLPPHEKLGDLIEGLVLRLCDPVPKLGRP